MATAVLIPIALSPKRIRVQVDGGMPRYLEYLASLSFSFFCFFVSRSNTLETLTLVIITPTIIGFLFSLVKVVEGYSIT